MSKTLVETNKKEALWSDKGFKAYQPLNVYSAEQDLVVHSEFRDGNVPAAYEKLRVFREALDHLAEGVEKVYLRAQQVLSGLSYPPMRPHSSQDSLSW